MFSREFVLFYFIFILFLSVGVTHVELKRDNSIFRVACSVTFHPVREAGEAG